MSTPCLNVGGLAGRGRIPEGVSRPAWHALAARPATLAGVLSRQAVDGTSPAWRLECPPAAKDNRDSPPRELRIQPDRPFSDGVHVQSHARRSTLRERAREGGFNEYVAVIVRNIHFPRPPSENCEDLLETTDHVRLEFGNVVPRKDSFSIEDRLRISLRLIVLWHVRSSERALGASVARFRQILLRDADPSRESHGRSRSDVG